MKLVKVAKLGAAVVEVAVADEAEVNEVLEAANISSDGFQVRVNGETGATAVPNGALVTLVPSIKGGN